MTNKSTSDKHEEQAIHDNDDHNFNQQEKKQDQAFHEDQVNMEQAAVVINENTQQQLIERIAILESQLQSLNIELQQREHELKARSQAEIENIQRRTQAEMEKIRKFSLEKIFKELLPVVDCLEKSLYEPNQTIITLSEGVNLTLRNLLEILKKNNVTRIEKENVLLNPDEHQALQTIESDEVKPNHVVKIIQTGYKLNNRLLRPALVFVAQSKE